MRSEPSGRRSSRSTRPLMTARPISTATSRSAPTSVAALGCGWRRSTPRAWPPCPRPDGVVRRLSQLSVQAQPRPAAGRARARSVWPGRRRAGRGDVVDQHADVLGEVGGHGCRRRSRATSAGRTVSKLLDPRGRDPRPARRRATSGPSSDSGGQAVPVVRVGTGHPGRRQPSQAGARRRRRAGSSLAGRSGEGAPTSGGQAHRRVSSRVSCSLVVVGRRTPLRCIGFRTARRDRPGRSAARRRRRPRSRRGSRARG